MKKYLIIISLFFFAGVKVKAADSDSLGLPGDNLDLAGVLDIFKTSTSLDDFEKKLNDPANEVNNLDLNNDGNVDYIRVVDQVSNDAHDIVLQVPVSETESQDVAVIEMEKNGTESAQLQISGDEELYGENYFVEPSDADNGATTTEQKFQGFRPVAVFVNVWMWPCVRYVYAPAYVVWVSPYRWSYYPVYWHPWHPVMWREHYNRVVRYHHHCAYVHECRVRNANSYYGPHRMASPTVHGRYAADHERHAARTNPAGGRTASPNSNQGQKVYRQGGGNTQKSTGKTNGGKQGQAGPRSGAQPKNGGGNKGGGKQGQRSAGGGAHKGGGGGGHKGGGGGGRHR